MFNKTTIVRTHTSPVTRVVERSISPDKVTEVYKEVKDEVEKKIVRSFVFNDNKVNGVVVEVEPDYEQAIRHLLVRFTLNGQENTRKITQPKESFLRDDAYHLLVGEFANEVMKMVARVAGVKLNSF